MTDANNERQPKVPFPSCRLIFTVMGFLGFVNDHGIRATLSVALVAMVNHTTTDEGDQTDSEQCPAGNSSNLSPSAPGTNSGEFNWDMDLQGIALAAFFCGFISTQVLGGHLADRFGGKWLFGGGIFAEAGSTLLLPRMARLHVIALIAIRIVTGMSAGLILGAMNALQAVWTPPSERSAVVSFVYSGMEVGIVVGMLLSGVLCDHGFAGGWPSVFYVFGMIGCVWSVVWFALCYNSPAEHPRISAAERAYLQEAIPSSSESSRQHNIRTPWRAILTSLLVWACALAFFAVNWGFFALTTTLPKFMYDILRMNMTEVGLFCSLPNIASGIVIVTSGILADRLRAPNRLSTTTVRKIFCAGGLILKGLLLVVSVFLGCNRALVVSTFVLAFGCAGFAMSVTPVNQLDLAPTHAGTLTGLTAMFAACASIAAPQVVGAMTSVNSTRSQWKHVFYLAVSVNVSVAIIFLVFGSGEEQNWAKQPVLTSSTETENGTAPASTTRTDSP